MGSAEADEIRPETSSERLMEAEMEASDGAQRGDLSVDVARDAPLESPTEGFGEDERVSFEAGEGLGARRLLQERMRLEVP